MGFKYNISIVVPLFNEVESLPELFFWIKKVMTDSNGLFTVKLKKGYTYQFLEEWQCLNFKMPQQTQWVKWDEKCFRERYATPNYVLNTKKTKQNIITFNYHQPCFYNPYCGNYSGPLPP